MERDLQSLLKFGLGSLFVYAISCNHQRGTNSGSRNRRCATSDKRKELPSGKGEGKGRARRSRFRKTESDARVICAPNEKE